ncbi:MAG: hypothetical protein M0R41_13150 [Methylobacter tundripaludum]|nr:hypothetical protein [Methylobacter tundripaludum]
MTVRKEGGAELCANDIYELFQGDFKNIYGDLIVVTANKPVQIIFQLEAAFTHMAVASLNNECSQENLKAALKHIQRASLDAAKMLWLAYKDRLDNIISDSNLRMFCINCPEDELIKAYSKAENLAEEARRCELNHIGVDPTKSLTLYYEASIALKEVFEKIDHNKLKNFKKFNLFYKAKEYLIGFIIGIFASVIATFIYSFT